MGGGAAVVSDAERDELTALESIFGGDLGQEPEAGWWSLRVQPHPGELEANHVACLLHFRYPAGYPQVPPHFRLEQEAGAECRELPRWLKLVESEAAAAAAQGSVCVFDAASLLQELLQEANEPEEGQESLWEAMQQREREREREQGGGGGGGGGEPHGRRLTWLVSAASRRCLMMTRQAGLGLGRERALGGLESVHGAARGRFPGRVLQEGGQCDSRLMGWTCGRTWQEGSAPNLRPKSRSRTSRRAVRRRKSSQTWPLSSDRVSSGRSPPSRTCCLAG